MNTPEINMMFFAPAGCFHERQIRESLSEIRKHGADSVCSNFLEDQFMVREVAQFARMAHEAGLRFYAMPGRVAGLFAAGPRLVSPFLTAHPEARALDEKGAPLVGDSGVAACLNHPEFIKWFYPFIRGMVEGCRADGILFDEPKTTRMPCHCPICREMAGNDESALLDLRERSFAAMLNRAAADVKALGADKTTLAMLMPATKLSFVEKLAGQPAVDAIGVDGPIHSEVTRKESIFDSAPRFHEIVRRKGRRTFVLVETFEMAGADQPFLDEKMPRVPELKADVFSFNYYAHANYDPDRVMQSVWSGIEALKRTKC
jgi:hypothetical protein